MAIEIVLIFLFLYQRIVNGQTEEMNIARKEAFDYIISQRHPITFGWSDGQTPAMILGLLSAKPTWMTIPEKNPDLSVLLTKNRLELEVLSALIKDPNLQKTDSANFALIVGALQVCCFDLTDFHGSNLIALTESRLDSTPHTSPAFASLVLILCNEGLIVPNSVLQQLNGKFKHGSFCPYCVETAGINIQALVCYEKYNSKSISQKLLTWLKVQNRKFIDSMQNKTGSFGNLISTSVALQAHHLTWEGKDFNLHQARVSLLSYRQKDGSFSNSLLYTALTIPALSLNTGVTGGTKLLCPISLRNSTRNTIRVSYKIEDMVYTKQSLRGSFVTERGNNLYKALIEYSDKHSDIIKVTVVVSPLGVQVASINDLKNDLEARTFWRTSIEVDNGSKSELLGEGLDKIFPRENVTYVFTYLLL